MSNKFTKLLVILTLSTILVAGCASTEPQADAAPALQVTRKVANESGWTEDQLKAMDTVEVEATSKSGEVNTYTGVLITSLLDEAQLASDASTLFLVGDDGYEAEATLEEIQKQFDVLDPPPGVVELVLEVLLVSPLEDGLDEVRDVGGAPYLPQGRQVLGPSLAAPLRQEPLHVLAGGPLDGPRRRQDCTEVAPMSSNLRWRIVLVVVVALFALALVWPTIRWATLTNERKEELNLLYSEMGQRAITDYDETNHHDNEITNILEARGVMIYFQLDKDWFYRAEERRWISLNDNSGWRRAERIRGNGQ